MNEFEKRAQHLQDHIPMGILDELLKHRGHDHPNGIFIKDRVCAIGKEIEKEFSKALVGQNDEIVPKVVKIYNKWFKKEKT